MVCNDNLNALVIEGKAPDEALKAAKSSLVIEFSELSGNMAMLSVNNSLKKILLYKGQLKSLQLCASLLSVGMNDEPTKELKKFNILVTDPHSTMKRIEGKMKELILRLDRELTKYNKSFDSTEKPTIKTFNDQLAFMSVFFKFNITMDITLAQYASYLNIYNKQNSTYNGQK